MGEYNWSVFLREEFGDDPNKLPQLMLREGVNGLLDAFESWLRQKRILMD